MRFIVTLFSLFISQVILSQSYVPRPLKGEVVYHESYSLSYVEKHEQAEWVYYKLTPAMVQGGFGRTDDFRQDPLVRSGSASLSDYKGSGYDRGHLAPAGDMKFSYASMSESFYMSNMSPQFPSFNRGGWKKLETQIRAWADSQGDLFVVTGPVFRDNRGEIGSNGVTVPGYYYKVVYAPEREEMIGFLMPNEKINGSLESYAKSVDWIESLTGLDFFYQLDDQQEIALESKTDIKAWGFGSSTSSTNSVHNPSHTASTSVQCIGHAKSSGSRCKNQTKNQNKYCQVHQSQAPGYQKPPVSGHKARCNATTQSGSQCKRNASSGSRFCWQHK